jgi:hypothetical protein
MSDWMTKGCEICRRGVLSATWPQPERVASSNEAQAFLHHCVECKSWWQFNQREAHVISETEAKETFHSYFNRA